MDLIAEATAAMAVDDDDDDASVVDSLDSVENSECLRFLLVDEDEDFELLLAGRQRNPHGLLASTALTVTEDVSEKKKASV